MSADKIDLLRSLINDDTTLSTKPIDNNLLIALLNCELYDVSNSFMRLKKYLQSKSNCSRLFGQFEFGLKLTEQSIVHVDFARRTGLNQIVLLVDISKWNPDLMSESDFESGLVVIVEMISMITADPVLVVIDVGGKN